MAIRKRTLEENGVEHTILLNGNQTLTEATKLFENKKFPEEDAYLVVESPNSQYNVVLFSDVKTILLNMGSDCLTQPLSNLPIPQASRVVPTDTTESGGEILDWVAINPQSTVVVTDAGKFAGLFTNPNRSADSGLLDNLSFLELHGSLVKLSEDPRANYVAQIQPPTCPHCSQQNFYKFNTAKQVYICPNCESIIE